MAVKPNSKGVVTGTKGNDKIYTGSGNDIVYFNSGDGADTLYKGSGSDTLKFNNFANVTALKKGLKMSKSKNNLVIKYTSKDSVTLYNYFKSGVGTSVATLMAKDGKTIKFSDFYGSYIFNTYTGKKNKTNKITGSALNDLIKGNNKNDTLNGGSGNDKIYGYAGADSIKGGNGNDYIDGGDGNDIIYGSSGTNTLKGGSGKDTIYGGTGNDKIYGGTGNDIIKAGKGNNTIYFNPGDGTDTIYSDGGADTLVFNGETLGDSFTPGTVTVHFVGNDLILSGENGKYTAILKDYKLGNHSAQWIQSGSEKIRVDELIIAQLGYNEIDTPENGVYTGSVMPDSITVTTSSTTVNADSGNDFIDVINTLGVTVNAGAGDDHVNITNANGSIINLGSGDDTLQFHQNNNSSNQTRLSLKAGDGNNTIVGIENLPVGGLVIDITDDPSYMYREVNGFQYILGRQEGNDLIIELTTGETLTITGYYINEVMNAYRIIILSDGYEPIGATNMLTEDPVGVTLTSKNNTYDGSKSTKMNIISIQEDGTYTVKLGDSDNNMIGAFKPAESPNPLEEVNADINITVGNGMNNVRLNNSGNSKITAGNGDNYIMIGGGKNDINVGDGNNYIYVNPPAIESTIVVGNGSNMIDATATVSNIVTTGIGQNEIYIGYLNYNPETNEFIYSENTVNSYGTDRISIQGGNTTVNLFNEYDKYIALNRYPKIDDSTYSTTVVNNVAENGHLHISVVNSSGNGPMHNAPLHGALSVYYSTYHEEGDTDGLSDLIIFTPDYDNYIILKNIVNTETNEIIVGAPEEGQTNEFLANLFEVGNGQYAALGEDVYNVLNQAEYFDMNIANTNTYTYQNDLLKIRSSLIVNCDNNSTTHVNLIGANDRFVTVLGHNGDDYVATDFGGNTSLDLGGGNNYVISRGCDAITVTGNVDVTLDKDLDRTDETSIYMDNLNADVTIRNVLNSNSTNIVYDSGIQEEGNESVNIKDFVFTHTPWDYDSFNEYGNGQDYITVWARNENGEIVGNGVKIYCNVENWEYDLANLESGQLLFNAGMQAFNLSDMSQYIYMKEIKDASFNFSDPSSYGDTFLGKNVQLIGTQYGDCYEDYETGYGKYIIDDAGGKDTLSMNEALTNFRFFFDVKADGTVGNDLFIGSYWYDSDNGCVAADCGFAKFFTLGGTDIYGLTIKNAFGSGKIESFEAGNGDFLQYANLIKNGTFTYNEGLDSEYTENSIVADVVAWLNDKGYSSVMEAIEQGGVDSDLLACFANTNQQNYYTTYWGGKA